MKNRIVIFSVILTISFGAINACAYLSNMVGQNMHVSLEDLPAALKEMSGGGVIFLKEGEYDDLTLNIVKRAEQTITIKPIVPGSVKLTGNSTLFLLNSSNIKLEGLLFEEVRGNSVVFDNSQNVGLGNNYFLRCGSSLTNSLIRVKNRSSDNQIYNNTFDDNRALGIIIVNKTDTPGDLQNIGNQIYGNLFYNIPSGKAAYPDSHGNGLEAIQLGQNDNAKSLTVNLNTKVYNNLFEEIIGDGVEIISNKSSGNQIYHNTFLNNRSGITLRAGDHVRVEGNYLYNTDKGIRVYGYGHVIKNNYIYGSETGVLLPTGNRKRNEDNTSPGYHQVENIEIANNYIVAPRSSAISVGEGERSLLPKNVRIANNRTVITSRDVNDYVLNSRVPRGDLKLDANEAILEGDFHDNEEVVTRRSNTRTGVDDSQVRYTQRQRVNRDQNASEAIREIIGVYPLKSLDSKVGADWKRPNKKQ